jgi:hypothetical protein
MKSIIATAVLISISAPSFAGPYVNFEFEELNLGTKACVTNNF